MRKSTPSCTMCGDPIVTAHGKARFKRRGYGYCGYACDAHAKTVKSHEDLMMRVINNVSMQADDECWPFTGRLSGGGYGVVDFGGRPILAHRIMYRIGHLETPPHDLFVCHSCDNPRCCNPGHLWLGTAQDNARDMVAKGRSKFEVFRGERHGCAKLKTKDVLEIRSDTRAVRDIARDFGVTVEHVRGIKSRKAWRHV